MLHDTFVDEQEVARRHPVRRFFGRLFLVLVLVCGAGAIYLWRYQPLAYGDTYGLRGDQVRETESVGGSNVVTYGAGEDFEMIFSVRNIGPVTVRITGLPERDLAALMGSYDVSLSPRHATAYDEMEAQPFAPFALRPGETRLLALSYTFRDCGQAATAGNRTVRRQAVRYQLAQRLERVSDVTLGQPLVITGMPTC